MIVIILCLITDDKIVFLLLTSNDKNDITLISKYNPCYDLMVIEFYNILAMVYEIINDLIVNCVKYILHIYIVINWKVIFKYLLTLKRFLLYMLLFSL